MILNLDHLVLDLLTHNRVCDICCGDVVLGKGKRVGKGRYKSNERAISLAADQMILRTNELRVGAMYGGVIVVKE
jgi:hypothetical protein